MAYWSIRTERDRSEQFGRSAGCQVSSPGRQPPSRSCVAHMEQQKATEVKPQIPQRSRLVGDGQKALFLRIKVPRSAQSGVEQVLRRTIRQRANRNRPPGRSIRASARPEVRWSKPTGIISRKSGSPASLRGALSPCSTASLRQDDRRCASESPGQPRQAFMPKCRIGSSAKFEGITSHPIPEIERLMAA